MLNALLREILTLFKDANLVLLNDDKITQEGNYLLFNEMRHNSQSVSFEFKVYVAGHTLLKESSSILERIEKILEICEQSKANAFLLGLGNMMSWDKVRLWTQISSLYVYEIALNVQIRI